MCETKRSLKLETETCGRCGGCGQYSYCQMYGTTCFKCGGRGKVLSKRGRAAKAKWDELRTAPAAAIVVGDVIDCVIATTGGSVGIRRESVVAITAGDAGQLVIETAKQRLWCGSQDPVKRQGTTAERLAWIEAVEAFVAGLARNGKPRVNGRTDAEQDALDAARRDKARAKRLETTARARENMLAEQRAKNGGRTDAEVRQAQAEEAAAAKALRAAGNGWLVEVLRTVNQGPFVAAMIEKLADQPVADLSDRTIAVLKDIYAKATGGRRGSKAYDAAVEVFEQKMGVRV